MLDTIIKEFKDYLREGKDEEVLLTFITRAYQFGLEEGKKLTDISNNI